MKSHGITNFFQTLCHWTDEVSHQGYLLKEGVLHIDTASDEMQECLARDVTSCLIETGSAIAEESVSLEANIVMSTINAVEQMVFAPKEKANIAEVAVEYLESLTSSLLSAFHAVVNIAHDLEKVGEAWEHNHDVKMASYRHP